MVPAVYMCTKEKRSNLCPNLHKGVQDPVSFTVTTGLLDRLGLGLRVRVSIVIIVLGLGLGSGLGFRVQGLSSEPVT